MTELWLLAGFFAFVMGATALLGYVFVLRPAVTSGASQDERSATASARREEVSSAQLLLERALQLMGEAVPASQAEANPIRRLLIAAGYRRPAAPAIFYGVKCAGMVMAAIPAGWATLAYRDSLWAACITGLCAAAFTYRLPDMVLRRLTKARGARLRRALPAALDMLVLGVEGGQTLDAAILEAGRELRFAHADLSDELALMHLELRAGRSRADALRLFAERTGEPEVRKLVQTLIDSDRFGTGLAQDLRNHAKYLRTRMRQKAQEQARKVAVKLVFPVFFLIFPSVLLVTLGPAVLRLQEQLHLMMSFGN
jgi:tight adherence protein C